MLRLGAVAIAVLMGMGQARAADKEWHFEDGTAVAKNGSRVEMSCNGGFVTAIWVQSEENLGDLKTRDEIYVTFTADPGTNDSRSVTVPVTSISHLIFESLYLIQREGGLKLAALATRASTSLEVNASARADAKAGDDDFFHITTLPAAGAAAAVLRVTDNCGSALDAKSSSAQAPSDAPATGEWFVENHEAGKAAIVLADADISLSFSCQNVGTVFDFSMADEILQERFGNRPSVILLFAVDASKRWHKVDLKPASVDGRTHFHFPGPLAASWSRLAMSADRTIEIALTEDAKNDANSAYDATVFSAKGSMAAIRGVLTGCR